MTHLLTRCVEVFAARRSSAASQCARACDVRGIIMFALVLVGSTHFDRSAIAQTRQTAISIGAPEFLQLANLARMLDEHAAVAPEKWAEVARIHHEYFERYKAVFESDDLCAGLGLSERTDFGWWSKRRAQLDRDVAAVETSLFDSLAQLAPPEQRNGIERIRRRWAATRISDSLAISDMDSPILADLTAVVYDSKDATAFLAELTPTLEAYELQRAVLFAALVKAHVEFAAQLGLARAAMASGPAGQGDSDNVIPGTGLAVATPQTIEAERALQAKIAEFSGAAEAALRAIHAMQIRTLAALATHVPSRIDRLLVDRFIRAAYANLAPPESSNAARRLARAMRLVSLTPQERDAIVQIEALWWQDDRALCIEAMETINTRTSQQNRDDPELFLRGRGDDDKIFKRRRERSEAAQAALSAVIGADRMALLDGPSDAEHFTPTDSKATLVLAGSAVESASGDPSGSQPDSVRPGSWRDLQPTPTPQWRAFIERRVAGLPDARVILDRLWIDLEKNWAIEVRAVQAEVDALTSQVNRSDKLPSDERPKLVKRAGELQLQSIAAARKLVAAAVDQVQAAFPEFTLDSARAALLWYDLDWLRMANCVATGGRSPAWIPNVVRVADRAIATVPPSELDRQIVASLGSAQTGLAVSRTLFEVLLGNQQAQRECKPKDGGKLWADPTYKALKSAEMVLNDQRRDNMRELTRIGYDALASLGEGATAEQRSELQRLARRDANTMTLRGVPELEPLIAEAIESLSADDPRAQALKSLATEASTEQDRLLDEFLVASTSYADPGDGPAPNEIARQRNGSAAEIKDDLRQHVQRTVLQLEAIFGREQTRALRDYRKVHAYFFAEGDRALEVRD